MAIKRFPIPNSVHSDISYEMKPNQCMSTDTYKISFVSFFDYLYLRQSLSNTLCKAKRQDSLKLMAFCRKYSRGFQPPARFPALHHIFHKTKCSSSRNLQKELGYGLSEHKNPQYKAILGSTAKLLPSFLCHIKPLWSDACVTRKHELWQLVTVVQFSGHFSDQSSSPNGSRHLDWTLGVTEC